MCIGGKKVTACCCGIVWKKVKAHHPFPPPPPQPESQLNASMRSEDAMRQGRARRILHESPNSPLRLSSEGTREKHALQFQPCLAVRLSPGRSTAPALAVICEGREDTTVSTLSQERATDSRATHHGRSPCPIVSLLSCHGLHQSCMRQLACVCVCVPPSRAYINWP